MIEHTKKLVEDKFTTVGGYEHNAEVKQWMPCSCVDTNLADSLLSFSCLISPSSSHQLLPLFYVIPWMLRIDI